MGDHHIVGANRRVAQQVAVRPRGWTKARRMAFLKALAETCNVRMASEIAGVRSTSVYHVRKRDPAFAALWQEALASGYERLETALLRRALIGVNEIDVGALLEGDTPGEPRVPGSGIDASKLSSADVQLSLALLNRHRATVEGTRGAARGRRRATQAETDAALTKKLDMLARKLGGEI